MLPLKWAIGWITEMVQLFFLLNQFHRTFTKNCLNLTLYNCLSLGTAAPWSTFIYLSLISDWWKISHLHIWGTQIVLLPGNFVVEYPGELQNKQLLMHAEYKIQGNKVQQLMTSRSSCRTIMMSQNCFTCSSLNFLCERGKTDICCFRRDYISGCSHRYTLPVFNTNSACLSHSMSTEGYNISPFKINKAPYMVWNSLRKL